jgi:hypothetical protein
MSHGGTVISELPSYIRIAATEKRLYLIADFDHPTNHGGIPVYFINRSGESITFSTQDGYPYLKLQYQDTVNAHRWIRAQPHYNSWCGNSYYSITLSNNHFFIKDGYQPQSGTKATIRFHLFSQWNHERLSSNIGEGLINQDDIIEAENDKFWVNENDDTI